MYQDLEATLHDLFWDAEPDADESHLLEAFLQSHPGKALEVGCGSGRLMLPLLAKGHAIDGIEVSKDMVDLLHERAKQQGLSPTIFHADACEKHFSQHYHAICIPAFTLQLLSRKMAKALLVNLRRTSVDSAGLYLSVFIPWAEIVDELESDVWHLDKEAITPAGETARCHTRHNIERVTQTLDREHHYTLTDAAGAMTQEHFVEQSLQWYLLPEIKALLESAGWSLENWTGDFLEANKDPDASVLTIYASAASIA